MNKQDTPTFYEARINNGPSYEIFEEAWNIKGDYYLDTFVAHLGDVIQHLKRHEIPLKNVLELGIARGVLSIGIAHLTSPETRIVGIDIDPQAQDLVRKNADANNVADRIEVRIGDMFAPVRSGEQFDLILGEMPILPLTNSQQQSYREQGFGSEVQNICGGEDGRYFIDALIAEGSKYLSPKGAIVFIQPSFTGVDRTLEMFKSHGLSGEIIAQREHPLHTTKFTSENRDYIESIGDFRFPTNAAGEEVFHLVLLVGTKES